MNLQHYFQFVVDFFADRQFAVLLSSTIIMFFSIFIMWYFYHKQLTKKDLFASPKEGSASKLKNFFDKFMYFCKYLAVFPLYSFVWFLIFCLLKTLSSFSVCFLP